MKLCIPQATEKGFIEVEPNGAFDWAYPDSKTRRGRVQMGGAVSPTLTCSTEIYVYEVIFDSSNRGRNPDNPSERAKSNGNYRQRFEPNRGGLCNTITSVQKDNLVVEYVAQPIKRERTEEEKLRRHLHGDKGAKFSARQMVPGKDGVMGAITTVIEKDNLIMEAMIQNGEVVLKKERASKTRPKGKGWEYVEFEDGRRGWVRLRKLTPRECYRLQGVREEQIDILLSAGISDSQSYKLAGNSICVDCMVGIFRNLFSNEEQEQLTLF